MLHELQRHTIMASYGCYVVCLFVVLMASGGTFGCDPDTGPAGLTKCYLSTPYYSGYQCSTCLTDAYIKQRSRGKHQCRNRTATYCFYQCMLEIHGKDRGDVSNDCLCNRSEPLPQPSVLPRVCYSPDGTDCDWYRNCLAEMYNCTGQDDNAIEYGERFCKLYTESQSKLSRKGRQWLDAARRCLQVKLVHFLHYCRERSTCEHIRKFAFDSHRECYVAPYNGPSVCDIPVADWLKIFCTIKSSCAREFLLTMKTFFLVAANCPSRLLQEAGSHSFTAVVRLFKKHGIEKRAISDDLSNDELAHDTFLQISSSLHWDQQSTMDWYAFAAETTQNNNLTTTASTDQARKQLRIQLFVVDRADIGLMNESKAKGRRRLNESIAQLYDVIKQGLTGTVHSFRFDVTSLRQCTSDQSSNVGCTNGTVVAVGRSDAGDTMLSSTVNEPVITTVSPATEAQNPTCCPTTPTYIHVWGMVLLSTVTVFVFVVIPCFMFCLCIILAFRKCNCGPCGK